jgi:solute:Na+ symporter, SSS family
LSDIAPATAALGVLAATVAGTLILAVGTRGRGPTTLEQWSVGSRGFGALLVFVLMAGEIYTTFTFLGASGWAYARGAAAFYVLVFPAVAYLSSYFLLPAIWARGHQWRVLSQPEYFARAYQSRVLEVLTALVGGAALLAYLVLQLRGLGIIVQESSYGAIPAPAAIVGGMLVVVSFTALTGVRGSAYIAAFKDLLVLSVALGLGLWLPWKLHGGVGPMVTKLVETRPDFLLLSDTGLSRSWFVSTTVLSALGFYLWPHTFASLFTACNALLFRRNAMLMPLYQVVLLLVCFVGFAAALAIPGLTGSEIDLALLRLARQQLSPWLVGVVGAAGMLTALVPAAFILMNLATLLARLPRATPLRVPASSDASPQESARTARLLVPIIAAVAVAFTFRGGTTIVALLLMAYNLVAQLAPALLASLWIPRFVSASGAIAGLVIGEALVALVTLANLDLASVVPTWPRSITDINIGLIAVLLNTVVMLAVSGVARVVAALRTPQPRRAIPPL